MALSNAPEALPPVQANTAEQLAALKQSAGLPPALSEAMKGAINTGVSALPVLGVMYLTFAGFKTILGMPPTWVKKVTLQE